ncbi:hypothetical protein EJD97_014605, partial [Solanum chilense]
MQHLSHAATPNGERKKLKDYLSYEGRFQNTKIEIEVANVSVDAGLCTMTESKSSEYPHTDFSNFDKDKDESCFKVGHVWFVYDTFDVTWLEPEPLNETKGLNERFIASCCRFRIGNLEHIEDHIMFSHLVCATNGKINDPIKIFPLKAETWALLKDWGSKELNYEFDVV